MSGMYKYRGGDRVFAYRVRELPCDFHVNKGVKVGDWAVLNQDGTLYMYMKNDQFLSTFVPDESDIRAQNEYINAAFEKSLPGG